VLVGHSIKMGDFDYLSREGFQVADMVIVDVADVERHVMGCVNTMKLSRLAEDRYGFVTDAACHNSGNDTLITTAVLLRQVKIHTKTYQGSVKGHICRVIGENDSSLSDSDAGLDVVPAAERSVSVYSKASSNYTPPSTREGNASNVFLHEILHVLANCLARFVLTKTLTEWGQWVASSIEMSAVRLSMWSVVEEGWTPRSIFALVLMMLSKVSPTPCAALVRAWRNCAKLCSTKALDLGEAKASAGLNFSQ
jgi:hypothetical protein